MSGLLLTSVNVLGVLDLEPVAFSFHLFQSFWSQVIWAVVFIKEIAALRCRSVS